MKRAHKKKPLEQRKIAFERVVLLFDMAGSIFRSDPKLSDRYVDLARKIAMKFKVRIPSVLKKQFCKNCYCFLVPGSNCTVRLQKSKVVYFCKKCKHFMRFPYIREIKEKRKKK
jgi:ribonuclease P protein subunit RPR2